MGVVPVGFELYTWDCRGMRLFFIFVCFFWGRYATSAGALVFQATLYSS